jgi:tetratricopeptide (TPR) repeat protein
MKRGWVALAVALCLAQPVGSGQLPSTGNLLERYSRGDFAAFTPPRTPLDVERFRQALEHDAASWLGGGDARTERRRHLTAATIALEAAHASIDLSWAQGRQLIEWGSALLRKAPPDEAERRWHLAALSVIQGAYDNELLVEQQKLAWPRFQGEPRFLLALLVRVEGDTWPDPDRGEPWDNDDAGLETAHQMDAARRSLRQSRQPDLREKAFEYERRTRMRQTIEALEDLSNAVAIRPDVVLRLGYLHLRLQHVEIALEQFEEVLGTTEDPFLLYLAHFLGGVAREQQADRANAIAAYRAALAVVPRAQSATFALASLLFLGDTREEAARLIDAAVTVPVADDPWRGYQAGDFRLWTARLSALREVLR